MYYFPCHPPRWPPVLATTRSTFFVLFLYLLERMSERNAVPGSVSYVTSIAPNISSCFIFD